MFLRGYSSVDECSPHVLERVFVHCLVFLRGYSSMDEYLPHGLGWVFVRRMNTCPMFLRRYSSSDEYLSHEPNTKPTNTKTYLYLYSCEVCTVIPLSRGCAVNDTPILVKYPASVMQMPCQCLPPPPPLPLLPPPPPPPPPRPSVRPLFFPLLLLPPSISPSFNLLLLRPSVEGVLEARQCEG